MILGGVTVVVIVLAGLRYGPEAAEGTDTACGAVYAQRIASNSEFSQSMLALRGSRTTSPRMQRAVDSTLRSAVEVGGLMLAIQVERDYPQADPELVCAYMYWKAAFIPNAHP
jgi:hypothetical protein